MCKIGRRMLRAGYTCTTWERVHDGSRRLVVQVSSAPLRQAGCESLHDQVGGRDMTVSPGFTAAEIREFVHEYQAQPYGAKAPWLITRGLSRAQLRRWRDAVFEGDLDRGLVPRESNPMTVPPSQRAALERYRAAERAAHEAEVARMSARIRELEGTNDALGKAIGLLHSMSEQESDEPTTTDPAGS